MNLNRPLSLASFAPLLGILTMLAIVLPATSLRAQGGDILFRAMRDELTRSVDRLKLEEQGTPYFVEYRVIESEGVSIEGTFGAITTSRPYKTPRLAVTLRVGDYGFDNSGFFSRDDLFSRFSSMRGNDIVLDDDYMAIRRDFWLATDKAYKDAVQQMAAKRGYLKNRISEDTLSDFSREKRVVQIDSSAPIAIDTAMIAKKIRSWSALFKKYPDIDQSSIAFNFGTSSFYLMNNEWTQLKTINAVGNVTINLLAHGSDGTKYPKSFQILLSSPSKLPSDKEVEAEIEKLVSEVLTIRKGGTLEESYIGPVLLVADAAPQFFLQVLVPHLSGSRLPLLEDESFGNFLGAESPLTNRINRRIMPREFRVYDDPTITHAEGKVLRGSYQYDHQGVPASHLSLVENGVLKRLLASRRPGKGLEVSNGHGRGADEAGTAIGTLFIETSEMLSEEEMKQQLIESCRELDLEYGIMIRNIGAKSFRSMSGGGVSISFGGSDDAQEGMEAWKVYVADGREEPIRNIEPGEVDYRTLKEIVAAGGKKNVLNTSVTPQGIMSFSTVPATVVAPSILLEEVQIDPSKGEKQKPTLLTHPYFEK